jgi:hypothetical protein
MAAVCRSWLVPYPGTHPRERPKLATDLFSWMIIDVTALDRVDAGRRVIPAKLSLKRARARTLMSHAGLASKLAYKHAGRSRRGLRRPAALPLAITAG